ncbi:MAG: MFS transporter [Candidatus Hodarchaeales archaeon]
MKAVSHLNLNIYTLVVTNFLWGFVNFVFVIQIQPYLVSIYETNDAVAQILGLIISIGSLAAVIPLVLGFLSDLYGRKRNIIFGQILSIVGLLGLATGMTDIIFLLPSIILFNLGVGLYDAPLQGLIYESSTRNRGLAYSFVYNSSYLSGITSSFLLRIGNMEFTFFFQLGLFLFLVSLIINVILLHDIKPNVKKLNFPLIRILRNPTSRLIAVTFAIDAFIWGLPLSIANTIYILVFKVDLSFIATLTLVETIIMVLLAYPAGRFVDRFGRIAGLIVGEFLGIIWIILVFTAFFQPDHAQELITLAYAFLGAVVVFWRPSVTLSFISIDSNAAATNFGILAFIQRLGRVPAAGVAGFLFPFFGFPPLLLVTFFGTFIIIGVFYYMEKENNKQKTSFY